MPELKQLSDFYDPTKAGMAALNVMQGQQHMAIQQQQADQQGRNLEIDNLQQALKSANPMEAWPIYDKLSKARGLESVPIDKYLASQSKYNAMSTAKPGTPEHDKAVSEFAASTPESQKIFMDLNSNSRSRAGASTLLSAAKLPNDQNSAELAMNNPSILKELTDSQAQSPKQVEEAKRLQMANDEHEGVIAAWKTNVEPLLTASSMIGLKMQRVMPYIDKMKGIEDEYVKDLDRYGSIKAAGKRTEAMLANPELQQMEDARKSRTKELKSTIAELENQQAGLEVSAQSLAWGAREAKPGESVHLITGAVDKNHFDLLGARAELKVSESPTHANLEAFGAVKANIDRYVASMNAKKQASDQSLNLRRAGLDEKRFMDQYKIQQESNEGKAQADWLEAGANVGDLPRIARQYGVSPEKIRDAAKDPNHITTKVDVGVNMPKTTEEAGKITMMEGASRSIDAVSKAITKPDGSIDRGKLFAAAFNVPFTEGRDVSSMMSDAMSAKLRGETGAAANESEMANIMKRFDLSTLDSDATVKSKLARLKRFMDETRFIRDPSGKIREVAAKGFKESEANANVNGPSPKGKLSQQEKSELDSLRKKYGR